ncbi:MAG: hypothetical protein HYU41_14165 [Candidatus Rokubacteria bacterium]|nr:hypothetical protein [Candidatus Rokubacteria bacterium]
MRTLRLLLGSVFVLMLAAIPAAPAAAAPPDLVAEVVLYETSESIDLSTQSRVAPVLGAARIDSLLCLTAAGAGLAQGKCLVTGEGRADPVNGITGTLSVVVEGSALGFTTNSNDVAEVAVTTATFTASFAPVTLPDMPPGVAAKIAEAGFDVWLGITGSIDIDHRFLGGPVLPGLPFTGKFRLPFAVGKDQKIERARPGQPAFYLSDSGKFEPAKQDERSIGWATPRLEVTINP